MRTLTLLCALVLLSAGFDGGQADPRLIKRWVGTNQGFPLWLDFYGDTMLVLNDTYALDYFATPRALEAVGDTAFRVNYWFARDRLLLETEDGRILTMAEQNPLARPLFAGTWRGTTIGREQPVIDLRMYRGGVANYREIPEGEWVEGEYDRSTRIITFTWFADTLELEAEEEAMPDSLEWVGQYDPDGNALLFPGTIPEESIPDAGTVVLRRAFRW
jgi:hypothetical protein